MRKLIDRLLSGFKLVQVAAIPPDCRLDYHGTIYDRRYWHVVYLDDSPPMYDMGKDYVWEPDTMIQKKEWWSPTYGTIYDKVSDMPKAMQDEITRRRRG